MSVWRAKFLAKNWYIMIFWEEKISKSRDLMPLKRSFKENLSYEKFSSKFLFHKSGFSRNLRLSCIKFQEKY